MTGSGKGKGDKASQATPCEAAQRQNLRLKVYTNPTTGGEIFTVGDTALLDEPLLGVLSSRECSGAVILETLDKVPAWVQAGWVVVSGFHAPLEQQVLRSLLRRRGCAVRVLARSLDGYRMSPQECEAVDAGRLLLVSIFPASVRHTTRETSLARNRWVIELAKQLHVPYVRPGSPLAAMLDEAAGR